MASEVVLQEGNGDNVWTTVTSTVRFCSADVYDPGTNYPVPVPQDPSIEIYSYWKNLRLRIGGSFSIFRKVEWVIDDEITWNLGSSGAIYAGKKAFYDPQTHIFLGYGCPYYYQATGKPGITGDFIGYKHPWYEGEYINDHWTNMHVTQVESGQKLLVDARTFEDHEATDDPVTSYILVLQCRVSAGAHFTSFSPLHCTWTWEEL